MDKIYHVGFLKDYDCEKKNRVIVQLRQSIDFLSCELWQYIGQKETTKKHYKDNKYKILQWINEKYNHNFNSIVID